MQIATGGTSTTADAIRSNPQRLARVALGAHFARMGCSGLEMATAPSTPPSIEAIEAAEKFLAKSAQHLGEEFGEQLEVLVDMTKLHRASLQLS